MTPKQNAAQRTLCILLHTALTRAALSAEEKNAAAHTDMDAVVRIAEKHSVLPLLYDVLTDNRLLSEAMQEKVDAISRKTVKQSYRLLFLTRYLIHALAEENVPAVVLKGCGAAAYYPVPELRKSGDVDLLIRSRDADRAVAVMEREGYQVLERQNANHHIVCCGAEGISVELHIMMAEPFSDERINTCMKQISEQFAERSVCRSCMGVEFPVLPEAWQAFQLLLHMLQHFLRAGFGLKLLCDWTVFWNAQEEDRTWRDFLELAASCGLDRFAGALTDCCVEFFGLAERFAGPKRSRELSEAFLCDVFEAEEFGHSDKKRMVALQGSGPAAYWREFHHQMKLNHPKASRCILLWPVLWAVTLVVFLYHNRSLKRGSARKILQNAGQRGRLVEQMGLDGKKGEKHAGN